MFNGLPAHTHDLRVLIEPRLRGLDNGSCSQRLLRRSLELCTDPFHGRTGRLHRVIKAVRRGKRYVVERANGRFPRN
jgi:hypothetical protein